MPLSQFVSRHVGPTPEDIAFMLGKLGVASLEELIGQTVPQAIRLKSELNLSEGTDEPEYLDRVRKIAASNKVFTTYIGMGYYNTFTPSVITRHVLENASWYTPYTPYQAEISQGRLEALLNFQTMITELTAMEIANASLLDEASAAAEALVLMYNTRDKNQVANSVRTCLVDPAIWPQTLSVLNTRATGIGIEIELATGEINYDPARHFGVILQYPNSSGEVRDYSGLGKLVHGFGGKVAVAADLMALALLVPPGEWGADIVFGTTQRFGIPMAYGGPHAAYFATRENLKREIPGRIIGITRDMHGRRALRMALQTREQHIKREKATSNICTAQALLATMAGFYAMYHGADGLRQIARKVHGFTCSIAQALQSIGLPVETNIFFDTLVVKIPVGTSMVALRELALGKGINLRYLSEDKFGISIDETTCENDLKDLISMLSDFTGHPTPELDFNAISPIPASFLRTSAYFKQDIFQKYRSETAMARYIKKLERKDISLVDSMIPLGSCTMKLNPATAMMPLTWPGFATIHPFVPVDQATGYHALFNELSADLAEITGFTHVTLQPTSGATGEYAGLMVIRAYHASQGNHHRDIALIPSSAHGTNPASAVMAGLKVVVVACDDKGSIDMADLSAKAQAYSNTLACLMVTYPSTHGVFETSIIEACQIVHQHGGQVYMDGANMNAQVGLAKPALMGADVCHLNLHKTFAIPHGGGGPGAGPVAVAPHLAQFLPGHPSFENNSNPAITVAAAPWGNAGILPITYGYIKMMGGHGLTHASKIAILNANYLASQLEDSYGVVFTGENKRVAHELILECRQFKNMAGITELDIAKRLMDYGFHAPTLSFPVAGTLMVEPTESEPLSELNRFVEAMKAIRDEIREVEIGKADLNDNVLKNAPHPAYVVTADDWSRPYSREKAAFPLPHLHDNKFWVPVARVDNAYGDRNLICTCEPVQFFEENGPVI